MGDGASLDAIGFAVLPEPARRVPSAPVTRPARGRRITPLQRARALSRLTSWLGPWRDKTACPPNVAMQELHLAATSARGHHISGRIYRPTDIEPIGSYLFAHGLSFQGPGDPRMDRFARVIAHAGFVVVTPTLHEHTLTLVDPLTGHDFCEAARELLGNDLLPPGRPGVFGVSFGGFPALVLASHPELGQHIGGCVVFGGYADFPRSLRFAMGIGRPADCALPTDQSCLPGVYVNLLPQNCGHLGTQGMEDVGNAMRQMVAATWGKPEMKPRQMRQPIAERIAATLTPAQAEVFMEAAWMTEGGAQRCSDSIGTLDLSGLDPRLHMHNLRCPLYLLHGADDEIISAQEALDLAAAAPEGTPVHLYLTGMYDHGGQGGHGGDAGGLLSRLRGAPAAVREVGIMLGMIDALVKGGSDPLG